MPYRKSKKPLFKKRKLLPVTARRSAEVEKAILETVEEEQRRIGHDLHDGLCQQLAGVALLAKALAHKLSTEAPGESSDASEIAELINQSIDQTRGLARGLSPVEIEVAGLVPALQVFADKIERLYKISCVFIHRAPSEPERKYASHKATHLYRIVQEAVTNAVQHGKAQRIVVTLISLQNNGLLTIQDNGIGFQSKNQEKPGLGLRSMRYRSGMIGARLKIIAHEDGGTIVACSFPHKSGNGKHEK
jgi:signal transduction histidine kinase